jgi:ABC-type phosphate/phosphonate transport system substrate-binding protein
MVGQRVCMVSLTALAAALSLAAPVAHGQEKKPPEKVKIGMAASLFRAVSQDTIDTMMPSFQTLVRNQTGMEADMLKIDNIHDMAKQLQDGQIKLGVFHGFEFAWVQQKYAELRPLVIAINRQRILHAYLMVRDDSKAANLADLKGKVLALPGKTRAHCLLFLDRECQDLKTDAKGFFGKIVTHDSIEDALDDILRDKVQAALVDGVALDLYDQVKPGCFARLKVLKKSVAFPANVVAYRQGSIDEAKLAKFRSGMLTANETERGKELMSKFRLTSFEAVTKDYEQSLASILKAYPTPVNAGADKK